MDIRLVARPFEAIGAQLKIQTVGTPVRGRINGRRVTVLESVAIANRFAIDVAETKRGEVYQIAIREDAVETTEFQAVDVRPEMRHLVLMARSSETDSDVPVKRKFLCGHDERHWFAANLPKSTVTSVEEAMESLKPAGMVRLQAKAGVRLRDWNRRKNAAFLRQGEWFFLPEPDFVPPHDYMVLRDEPIRRGAGKPHTIEFLYRDGGESVWVCNHRPNGLTERQYEKLIERNAQAKAWHWRQMRRNPDVYAKGRVRHADHATIVLPFWHRVRMNTEEVGRNVAFLD